MSEFIFGVIGCAVICIFAVAAMLFSWAVFIFATTFQHYAGETGPEAASRLIASGSTPTHGGGEESK